MKRFYSLEVETHTLRVFEQKDDVQKLKQVFELAHKVTRVDDTLQPTLRNGYEKDLGGPLVLPKVYDKPFAIIFGRGEIMLLWASTEKDFQMWTVALKALMADAPASKNLRSDSASMLRKTSKNSFCSTLYQWLQPSIASYSLAITEKVESPRIIRPEAA